MLGVAWQLFRCRRQYDVIHAMQVSALAAAAVVMGRILHKPVVIAVQSAGGSLAAQGTGLGRDEFVGPKLDVDPTDWRVGAAGDLDHMPRSAIAGRLLFRLIRRSSATYHILSSRTAPLLIDLGFPADRIVRISGSVDTDVFRPPPTPSAARQQGAKIVCVSRLSYEKGIDLLLQAWSVMRRQIDDRGIREVPTLTIVGDGPLRTKLAELAAELGIADTVEFLGRRDDIPDLLRDAGGFVLPSRFEGMPNALLEAMACGLPSVATRVSGSEEIIVDGENGLLVEPEAPVALAAALQRIVADRELAERLGQRARATVEQGYQLSQLTGQLVVLYRRLLGDCLPPTPHPS
jgi:glycosyltransferase involved in cell wall biosynthesis